MTGSGVMIIFIYNKLTKDLEIGNTPSEFCPTSGDWRKLGIPNLTQLSLIKCYWMLQDAKITAFIIPKLIRENY